jgi:hypothetical protein
MFEVVGYRVKRLLRIRIGNLRLGDLPRGHWQPLTLRELKALRSTDNSGVAVAGARRGRQVATRVNKPRSTARGYGTR